MSANLSQTGATAKWFYSRSRAPWELKKPKGFEDWFYTGPTLVFGCPNSHKKKAK